MKKIKFSVRIKTKPCRIMLQEYDAQNKHVYNAAMLTADFSEWLYIK